MCFLCFPFAIFPSLFAFFFYLPVCFPKREKDGVELNEYGGGYNLTGVGAGKDMFRIFCMKYYFQLQKTEEESLIFHFSLLVVVQHPVTCTVAVSTLKLWFSFFLCPS